MLMPDAMPKKLTWSLQSKVTQLSTRLFNLKGGNVVYTPQLSEEQTPQPNTGSFLLMNLAKDTYKSNLVCPLLPKIQPTHATLLVDLSSASASASASASFSSNSGRPQFNLDVFINAANRSIDIIKENDTGKIRTRVSQVSRRTAQHHNKRARFEAEKRSMKVDTEIIPTYQSDSVEAMDGQTNSPILDTVSTFDNDVFVGNDYNGDESDTTDDNDSDDNGEEDTAKIYVGEFNNEDPFAASGIPENPVHRFIATFTVLFASCYVVNKGSVVLIEFINELLKIYGQDFQLPKSLAGLYKMTGFLSITKDIKRFVSCPDCHCIYEENMSVPSHCVFTNVGAHSPCGCKLMKEPTSGALNMELNIVNTMCDIYNGAIWKELKDASGVSFVACHCSLMLTLNIDWFQLFDGVSCSSSAIYLVVNNLPQEAWFKPENTILAGLMPDEMKQLYIGMQVPTYECPSSANIHAALLMVACDIFAARKTSGFTAHNSTCACYNSVENRLHAEKWKSACTPLERHQLEVEYGVRWSQLTIIDPMHNLFLATLKKMMDQWDDKKTIGAEEFAVIEKIAETIVLSRDYTKLTSKIGKGFPYMKADDWKSWVLVYSPVLLHGPSIIFDEVNSAHDYLEMFCKKATKLYTPTILTCNMHLCLNLCKTIYNFEATYMRSFVQNPFKGDYGNTVLKSSGHVPLFNILSKLSPKFTPTTTVITLSSCSFQLQSFLLALSNSHLPPKGNEFLPPLTFLLQIKKSSLMDEINSAHLLQHYKTSYDLPDLVSYQYATLTNFFVDNEITKLKFIDLLDQQYRDKNGSASCGSLVYVIFVGRDGRNTIVYAGKIHYLFTYCFTHPSNRNLHLTRMVHNH
ncbi:hypothetical protein PHYBLDRAFT_149835 [Phycomyces blakesleeanus NRRL 1555(-)]|uniref:Uncharacterized protein n=1 Tax=Phycomyces blakesleeanus (strain ATCC 8743b / DSM 1359 / FGSC 10004 / NBRC 33097 / NRRL 1555) TaxID=763407 RepID=A0A162WLF3_PHYB8|nr:hypothetical protein PHYBLDRAFT_149835 [Phycomyces blakesleeanus NRRL 1555(-)]OAD68825.1 hypothetical protein PHYBLDRAFT_149835 [Phycomyces blakesleeanus NRRL 1555(-)]|eukprot:XP_018286865.1 hypothetical protein PHYBLDRAFT_149835 [Phycomyces blakesleeanus NRRL 1555(-)]